MTTLTHFIKRHEGLRLKVYKCSAGKLTIGYGRNLDDVGITEQEADAMLMRDIDIAINNCKKFFPNFDYYTNHRRIALASIMFNLGINRFRTFKKMIAAVRKEDWEEAAFQLKDSKRHGQIPNRSDEESDMLLIG